MTTITITKKTADEWTATPAHFTANAGEGRWDKGSTPEVAVERLKETHSIDGPVVLVLK